MGYASYKQRFPRLSSQGQLVVSHPAWDIIQLKAKDRSHGGFFALRGTHTSDQGMGLDFV